MLLGKKNQDSELNDDNELLIMTYIQQANFKDALLMLQKSEDNFFRMYNEILCYFSEDQLERAIELIGQALFKIPQKETETFTPTMLFEYAQKSIDGENSYLEPVSSNYTSMFPEEVEDNLIRLKLDILVKQEAWSEIISLSKEEKYSRLFRYSNAIKALELAMHENK